MSQMFLTADELIDLTGRKRCDAQRKALNIMGVDFLIRPDASLVVSR